MRIENPAALNLSTGGGAFALKEESGGLWKSGPFSVELKPSRGGCEICLRSEDAGAELLSLSLKWREASDAGLRLLGDAWERSYGDLEWRCLSPDRPMPWQFAAYDGRRLRAFGVETGASSFASWLAGPRSVELKLDLRCGGLGVVLGARSLRAACAFSFEGDEGEAPFAAMRRFSKLLCPKPLMPEKPVYGFNDWYYAYGENSQEGILRDSALCSDLASDPGNRPFSIIDAGWQPEGGTAGGPWLRGGARFPDMPGLAAKIKELGARPGLWYRPLRVKELSPGLALPRERFAKPPQGDPAQFLDPSVEESLERVKADVRRFRDWGFELIKHDFSAWDLFGSWGFEMGGSVARDGWSFHDRSRTSAEIAVALYEAIRSAAGDALLIGCNAVGHLVAGHAQLQRVGDDTSGREWERTRKMGVNALAFRSFQHGAFFGVDADCVGLTAQIPWRLNRQWLELLARSGTPLFVSASPEAAGRAQKLALKEAFASAARERSLCEPLDWFDSSCPEKWLLDGEAASFQWD